MQAGAGGGESSRGNTRKEAAPGPEEVTTAGCETRW